MSYKPIKVVEVELSQPLADFSGLAGYQALHALVRLHGAPLGWVRLPLANGRCSAAALGKAILEQHSWSIIRHLVADGLHAPLGSGGLRLLCRRRWHVPSEQMALEEVRLIGHRTLERFADERL